MNRNFSQRTECSYSRTSIDPSELSRSSGHFLRSAIATSLLAGLAVFGIAKPDGAFTSGSNMEALPSETVTVHRADIVDDIIDLLNELLGGGSGSSGGSGGTGGDGGAP